MYGIVIANMDSVLLMTDSRRVLDGQVGSMPNRARKSDAHAKGINTEELLVSYPISQLQNPIGATVGASLR